jgi:hypothetical protein
MASPRRMHGAQYSRDAICTVHHAIVRARLAPPSTAWPPAQCVSIRPSTDQAAKPDAVPFASSSSPVRPYKGRAMRWWGCRSLSAKHPNSDSSSSSLCGWPSIYPAYYRAAHGRRQLRLPPPRITTNLSLHNRPHPVLKQPPRSPQVALLCVGFFWSSWWLM